jgi:hypothetical protein
MNYYAQNFSTIETYTIGLWLHEAQLQLPHYRGSARLLLLEGIKAAASELLIRYREIKNT